MKATTDLKPTAARHWVIVFAVTLSILSYIDRVCISQAAPYISREFGLDKAQMGTIFSAFALAYALFEIPGGWLGDWMGPRKVLMRIVIWWSFFTAVTGFMWNYVSLWLCRFMFGAGEAGCFPNLTKSFTTWLPQDERVRAQGIMWFSARLGGAFTPPLVVAVIQYVTWHWAFVIFGLIGVVWAVFFHRWYRDNPRDHPRVNAAELALLKGAEATASGHGDVPWGKLVSSRSVWLLWAQYFVISYPWYFYITWLPTYLQEGRHLNEAESANLAIFPLLFGAIGNLTAGLLAPQFTRWFGGVSRARRSVATFGFVGAAAMMALHARIDGVLLAMVVMGLASFCNDLVMPSAWGACMDVGGKYAGTLSGSMNMMGNLAGFVAPTVGGWIIKSTGGDWNLFIYSMAGSYLLGVFIWPFIDPVTPLERDKDA